MTIIRDEYGHIIGIIESDEDGVVEVHP